jgi:hypothetical protein
VKELGTQRKGESTIAAARVSAVLRFDEPELLVEPDGVGEIRRRLEDDALEAVASRRADEILQQRLAESTSARGGAEIHLAQLGGVLVHRIETAAADHRAGVVDEDAKDAAVVLIVGGDVGDVGVGAVGLETEAEFGEGLADDRTDRVAIGGHGVAQLHVARLFLRARRGAAARAGRDRRLVLGWGLGFGLGLATMPSSVTSAASRFGAVSR